MRPPFDDAAKIAAGVNVRSLPVELAQAREQIEQERRQHAQQLASFVELVRTAIKAYDENRRGEALSILRALVRSRTPGKLALPESDPPMRA